MPGRKALRRVQMAAEVTPGTAVSTATMIWRGPAETLADMRAPVEIPEHVGIIGETDRAVIPNTKAELALPSVVGSFEQFPYLPAYAFGGPVAGVILTGTTPTGYVYNTPIPTTSTNAIRSMTIQAGDDFEQEQMEYSVIQSFDISGSAGEPVKVQSKWLGRQSKYIAAWNPSTPPALPNADNMLVSTGKLFIDAISGTFGTTLVSNQILGFKIAVQIMWVPKYPMGCPVTSEGAPMYGFLVYAGHKITGDITFEHDTAVSGTGSGARQNFRQLTPLKLRIQLIGKLLGTGGTYAGATYNNQTLNMDFPIKYNKLPTVSDKNGNDIVVMSFFSKYNQTAATAGAFTSVVDGIITLP